MQPVAPLTAVRPFSHSVQDRKCHIYQYVQKMHISCTNRIGNRSAVGDNEIGVMIQVVELTDLVSKTVFITVSVARVVFDR